MAATVDIRYVAYCAECSYGELYEWEVDATEEVAKHNREYHRWEV
jgi:predicted nucleic-acid-binding Zn-ribbon protein